MRRLINALDGGARPTWIILDGLTSLQHLTQLPAAIAEAHKANVRLVLGLHEFGQMEVLYGSTQADTILSGPLTKIFLRTSESRAAQWISRTIGGMEIERWEEGSKGNVGATFKRDRKSRFYNIERSTSPLVPPLVIAGLEDRCGYLKWRNLVVKARFRDVEAEPAVPGFLPRRCQQLNLLPPCQVPGGATAPPVGPCAQKSAAGTQPRPEDQKKRIIFD